MDFHEQPEYQDLARTLDEVVAHHWTSRALSGSDDDTDRDGLWRALHDLGVTALGAEPPTPQKDATVHAEIAVARALGSHSAPTAFIFSAGLGVPLARQTGDDAALSACLRGERLTIAVGRTEDLADPASVPQRGSRLYVPCPHGARIAFAILPDTEDTVRIGRVDLDAVSVTTMQRSDLQDLGWIELPQDLPTTAIAVRDLRRIVASAKVLLAAYAAGGTRRLVDLAASYARERQQFGAPIGSFQAVAHRCADMHVSAEISDQLVNLAAAHLERGQDAAAWRTSALTKAEATSNFATCASTALQVFAGHGFSLESDVQRYFRIARGLEVTWGTPAQEYDTAGSPTDSDAESVLIA